MITLKKLLSITLLLGSLIISGCGEGTVELNEAEYQPKIVIDGYIYPAQKVENIKITRNFPLEQDIDVSNVLLTDAKVTITDAASGKVYPLTYNPLKFSFEYQGNDLVVTNGKSYTLTVQAVIDGKNLEARSTTSVPLTGLKAQNHDLGVMKYREEDAQGNMKKFNLVFTPSDKCEFYAYSVEALDASVQNFIYDNPFHDVDSNDVEDDLDRYRHEWQGILNAKFDAPSLNMNIEWHSIWFYGNYKVMLYAADKNMADFVLTHRDVMEMDGNFHEPKMHIEGEGIGVFGSAVVDTVYFKVTK